ncbi:MAG TPA: hypothetical protein VGR37_21050 [Longimicrobiaceae bacterium]|nr:hypothetical protein [Longimicrobiaceae bacterium]
MLYVVDSRVRAPSAGLVRRVLLTASLPLLLGGCVEDPLDPGKGVDGPVVTLAPQTVALRVDAPDRAEAGDSLRFSVTAKTKTGTISEVGATLLVSAPGVSSPRVIAVPGAAIPAGQTEVTRTVAVSFGEVLRTLGGQLRAADVVRLEAHGYAVHSSGACAAGVDTIPQTLPCDSVGGAKIAAATPGQRAEVMVAAGGTVRLSVSPGSIGDLVVDDRRQLLFLSNRAAHRVDVLEIGSRRLRPGGILVGSEPWGLSKTMSGDTLIVANSGGVNVSFVPLSATGELREDLGRRFQIPRTILYEVQTEDGQYKNLNFFNYTDRPQFVAQDARGRLLYSTVATQAAPVGSIRVAEFQPGWGTWDARFLFHERSLEGTKEVIAIGNVDTVRIVGPTHVVLVDHVPGSSPQRIIRSDPLPALQARDQLRGMGSDAEVFPGFRWRLPEALALSDTTFVRHSADHRWIVFGEGLRTPAGRIMTWSAEGGALSSVEDIRDLVNNASDRIRSVDLNADGSLGVARGSTGSFFFGNDLRLLGRTAQPDGRGASFLPGATGLRVHALAATGRRSIQVVETTSYRAVGEVPIRDEIAGPFRVGPPGPGANACPADFRQGPADCVLARVYAVTSSGGVLILDVRNGDVR